MKRIAILHMTLSRIFPFAVGIFAATELAALALALLLPCETNAQRQRIIARRAPRQT